MLMLMKLADMAITLADMAITLADMAITMTDPFPNNKLDKNYSSSSKVCDFRAFASKIKKLQKSSTKINSYIANFDKRLRTIDSLLAKRNTTITEGMISKKY